MPKLPFMQFYVDDWKSEFGLALCSLAARGCWIEVLGAMHQLERLGVVTGTAEQLSRVCRCSPVELVQCFEELRLNGVAEVDERDGVYTIVNRRMRRESKERAQATERQNRFQSTKERSVNGNKTGTSTENKREINGGESETESYKNKPNGLQKRFSPPSVEEVESYCQERKNGISAQKFIAYYQSKGWKVGKHKMADWKAAVLTWEENNKKQNQTPVPSSNGGLMGIKIGGK